MSWGQAADYSQYCISQRQSLVDVLDRKQCWKLLKESLTRALLQLSRIHAVNLLEHQVVHSQVGWIREVAVVRD